MEKNNSMSALYSDEERQNIKENHFNQKKVNCPYCSGEATKDTPLFIWLLLGGIWGAFSYKLLKYKCDKCGRYFSEKKLHNPQLADAKKYDRNKIIINILVIISVLWLLIDFFY